MNFGVLHAAITFCLGFNLAECYAAPSNTFDWDEVPVAINYTIAKNLKASNCEFYINAFGDGTESRYHSIGSQLYESWISTDTKTLEGVMQAKILNVGAWFDYIEQTSETPVPEARDAVVIAQAVENETAYYRLDFRYHLHNMAKTTARTINKFAYFIDLRRRNGAIDRLWLTNFLRQEDKDFTVAEVLGSYRMSQLVNHGPGLRSVRYIEHFSDSPIYDAKKSCAESIK